MNPFRPPLLRPSRLVWLLLAAALLPRPAAAEPLVLEASGVAQPVTPRQVLALLIQGGEDGPVVVDCRNPKQYAEGHIPGAINVFHKDTWGRLDELRRYEARGIVYYDFRGVQSSYASRALLKEGFRKVGVMQGHFEEWVQLGYPVATGSDAR